MARIAGINIPPNKIVSIGLTYIHGIGLHYSKQICEKLNIPQDVRVNSLTEDQVLKINIAHNEGNYFTNPNHLKELTNENLIAFKYCNKNGDITKESNPNGSLENVAGIFNAKKNILGMMPHPERMVDNLISNTDGVNLFSSLLK